MTELPTTSIVLEPSDAEKEKKARKIVALLIRAAEQGVYINRSGAVGAHNRLSAEYAGEGPLQANLNVTASVYNHPDSEAYGKSSAFGHDTMLFGGPTGFTDTEIVHGIISVDNVAEERRWVSLSDTGIKVLRIVSDTYEDGLVRRTFSPADLSIDELDLIGVVALLSELPREIATLYKSFGTFAEYVKRVRGYEMSYENGGEYDMHDPIGGFIYKYGALITYVEAALSAQSGTRQRQSRLNDQFDYYQRVAEGVTSIKASMSSQASLFTEPTPKELS